MDDRSLSNDGNAETTGGGGGRSDGDGDASTRADGGGTSSGMRPDAGASTGASDGGGANGTGVTGGQPDASATGASGGTSSSNGTSTATDGGASSAADGGGSSNSSSSGASGGGDASTGSDGGRTTGNATTGSVTTGGGSGTTSSSSSGGSTGSASSTGGATSTTGSVDAGVPPLAITSESLPAALFEKSYSSTLSASGGVTPYHWSVSSGSLPAGITLSTSGMLQGSPTVDGDFTFQATVKDSATGTASATFTLRVNRKRWLAFSADESTTGPATLYLVDTSKSAYLKTPITYPQGTAGLDTYSFSPDGHWFEYTLSDASSTYSLYVIDVSGPTLGTSIRVGGPNSVTRPVWLPTSSAFSFGQADAPGSSNYLNYFVDLSSGSPSTPVLISGTTEGGRWISDDIYAYSGSSLGYVRRTGTTFSSPALFSFTGFIDTVYQSKAHVVPFRGECTSTTYVIDFAGPNVTTINNDTSVSFDFAWATRPNSSDSSQTDLVMTSALPNGAAAATIAGSPCLLQAWAHQSEQILWTDPNGKLYLTKLGANIATSAVVGNFTGANNEAFSSDDQWVATRANEGVFLTKTGSTSAATGYAGGVTFTFSPNAQQFSYFSSRPNSSTWDISLVDLRSGNPGSSRQLTSSSFTYIGSSIAWSSDDTHCVYLAGGQDEGPGVYVVDPRNPNDTGTKITPFYSCSSGGPCLGVFASVLFQP